MFKQVTGDQLAQFDPETIELYRKRHSEDRDAWALSQLARRARNHLPIPLSKNNKFL